MTLIGSGIENGSFGDNSTAMLQVDRFFIPFKPFQTQHCLLLGKKNDYHEMSHLVETACSDHASDWTASAFDCSSS
jgi:hypothetical protein